MSCHVMSCHVMPCHAMPCHAMPCHVMSCYVMLCYAGLFMIYTIYQILSGSSNNPKLIPSKIMKMLQNDLFFFN